jgi:hypothetical protein
MNSAKLSLRSIAALAVAGVLAGCAGNVAAPSTSSNVLPGMALQMQPAGAPLACLSDHGVSVKPCSIHLSISNPQQRVTTRGPKGGKFSFNDKACVRGGIATISGSGHSYTATWGNTSGSCTAVFTDKHPNGKTIGTAKLKITNRA